MKNKGLWVILALTLILSACSAIPRGGSAAAYAPPAGDGADSATGEPVAGEASVEGLDDQTSTAGWDEQQPRTDDQGAIMVDIVALNLNNPSDTLDFSVSLNTHSVDLSMDLAPLAMLTTDGGLSVPALKWDAPSGGHHVSGKLSFPASSDGTPLLSGAQKLTLTLIDLDAPQRVFVWEK